MNPILNERDDDSGQSARRMERIERMRREKQRQEEQRRMIKKLLPLVAGVFGVIIIIVCVVTVFGKKSERNEAQRQSNSAEHSLAADTPTEESEESGTNTPPEVGTESSTESGTTTPPEAGTEAGTGAGTTTPPEANTEKSTEFATTTPPEANTEESAESGTTTPPEAGTESRTESGTNTPPGETTANGSSAPKGSTSVVEAGMAELKNRTPVYSFQETANTANIYSDEIISTNIILIDESTDTVIASKGAKERISPASMTKVLTVLVAAEHIAAEDLDDTFVMTKEFTDYAYVNDCSSVGFLADERVTVRDLFYGTVLPSGGDAAVGLATYVAGSHEAFVDLMNEKLKELGLSESAHFTNCVGLYDDNHYCTVYDMAVIMKAAIQNDLCREVLSAHTYTTTSTAEHPEGIIISNWFLRRIEDKDTGGEVLCAKTGYVAESQSCAVSYGTFAGGTPYICVTAGSSSSWRCIYDHVDIYKQYAGAE